MIRPLALLLVLACQTRTSPPPKQPQEDPSLPGVEKPSTSLQNKLDQALKAKGASYKPRTEHLHENGTPHFTNRLIFETSPYLLQHAHNPVNWFAWGPEAFARAKALDRPIFLSVGYSTCHWCHVMERESFEDKEIAAVLNQHFVAIKVDREERPDVDDVYMTAVRILSGRGGWPMTVVMTPDQEPFFGGTYFPPRDGQRRGLLTILNDLHERYRTQRETLVEQAQTTSARLAERLSATTSGKLPGPEAVHSTARAFAQMFDSTWGGFGRAPKFPRPSVYDFLLRYHLRTGSADALRMVTESLDHMSRGGMYDHVGGGFHRYSTDARWLVPHFEKMLYDNAQLALIFTDLFQLTRKPQWQKIVVETLDYVKREMTAPSGVFYSATDADSLTPSGHSEEGYYFTWTPAELRAALPKVQVDAVILHYAVQADGNFEGRCILHTPEPVETSAQALGIDSTTLQSRLSEARAKLRAARNKRPLPILDNKAITAWNGLMIAAFARAGAVFGRSDYLEVARAAASAIVKTRDPKDGRLYRILKDQKAYGPAFAADYANLIRGLLELYDATLDRRWLPDILELQHTLDTHYYDDEGGGYYTTRHDAEALLARPKPSYDGAEPAANSTAALNLVSLYLLTGDDTYRSRTEHLLSTFAGGLAQGSTAMPQMMSALDAFHDTGREVVISEGEDDVTALMQTLRDVYLPNRALAFVAAGQTPPVDAIPWTRGKSAIRNKSTAYVCRLGACELPTSDPDTLTKQLMEVQKISGAMPLPIRPPIENPKPWYYDAKSNQHWHPGHKHWHDGKPPAQGARQ